ncbi:tRNA (adenosine(37)-N6)-dimethylallyltransferase MiaA [uncultured Succinivibrio sp.]|uniref:tRNA (adenosine(37)-N6)-dimethylallyltransferase MiaA n=1 Tax=uncultured Succinivibrio sp. TaxID=540749 RepID=UPI0025DF57B9|nr:tRNA (adenosine(37)-N6)-dimethylallyltransferase MiaA [uncultured Succinivibrio sp.]
MKNKALVILGPTASGKTSLALNLARHLKIEIISLDSALIYKGMDIGTAKPTMAELNSVPHHLIDICDPAQSYSAANFREDCIRLVDEISARGALPVICGGTMMYYKSLVDGLSPLPQTDPKVREKIAQEALALGWPKMHERLKVVDPVSYAKLNPNDKQRVSRALEIYEMTGRAMSSFFDTKTDSCPFDRLEFILLPENDDREELRKLIRKRFEIMVDNGLINEVSILKARGDLNLDMPSMRCVGYRQVWEYLDGKYDRDEMIEQCVIATAHLAKHQMTWLRGSLSKDQNYLLKKRLNIGDPKNLELVLDALRSSGFVSSCLV